MKLRFFLILILPLLLSGCHMFGPRHLHLTQKDAGKTFTLQENDSVTITLPGEPSDGCDWVFGSPYDERILYLVGNEYVNPNEELKKKGCRALKFLVQKAGRTGIHVVYRRKWDQKAPVIREFSIMIISLGGEEDNEWKPTTKRGANGEIVPLNPD